MLTVNPDPSSAKVPAVGLGDPWAQFDVGIEEAPWSAAPNGESSLLSSLRMLARLVREEAQPAAERAPSEFGDSAPESRP